MFRQSRIPWSFGYPNISERTRTTFKLVNNAFCLRGWWSTFCHLEDVWQSQQWSISRLNACFWQRPLDSLRYSSYVWDTGKAINWLSLFFFSFSFFVAWLFNEFPCIAIYLQVPNYIVSFDQFVLFIRWNACMQLGLSRFLLWLPYSVWGCASQKLVTFLYV